MIYFCSHQDFAVHGIYLWGYRLVYKATDVRIAKEAFGFGDAREVRKVLSLPWRIGTRQLESFVEQQNPYTDPWLNQHGARLLLHEEEAQITLPSGASETTVSEATAKLLSLAERLIS